MQPIAYTSQIQIIKSHVKSLSITTQDTWHVLLRIAVYTANSKHIPNTNQDQNKVAATRGFATPGCDKLRSDRFDSPHDACHSPRGTRSDVYARSIQKPTIFLQT